MGFLFSVPLRTIKFMTMTFKKICFLFIAALTTCSIQAQQVQLIPEPSSIQINKGTFKLPNEISIQVPTVFESLGTAMSDRLKVATGKKVDIGNQKNATIRFEQVQDNALGKEGYQLIVNEKGIHVKAQTYAGALYAWQSI
jgi:hexosaminidase